MSTNVSSVVQDPIEKSVTEDLPIVEDAPQILSEACPEVPPPAKMEQLVEPISAPPDIKPYPQIESSSMNPEEVISKVSILDFQKFFICSPNSKILSQDFWKLADISQKTDNLYKNFSIHQKLLGDFPPSYNFCKSEISKSLEESFGNFQNFDFIMAPKIDGIFVITHEKIEKARVVKLFYFGSGEVSKDAHVVQKYFRNLKI